MSRLCGWKICASSALFFTMTVAAQQAASDVTPAAPVGIVEQPCPAPITLPTTVRDLLVQLFMEPRKLTSADFERLTTDEQFKRFIEANRQIQAQDWPGRCRYRAANQSARAAAPPGRIVFMGDSITENWALADPKLFEGAIVNRGISGQTTPQMLVRFRADVISLKPALVHILAGTNDIAGNTGPTSVQDFKDNIMSMAELARAHGINVLLGSIPPAAAFNWRPGLNPAPRIKELNAWLRGYANQSGFEYIDYYTPLAGPSGELRADLGNDGVHPNRAGYRVMRTLIEKYLAPRAGETRVGAK
jgi:lysophospholipase L1-like esterase